MSGKSRISGKDGQYLAQLQAAIHAAQDSLHQVLYGSPVSLAQRLRDETAGDKLYGVNAIEKQIASIVSALDAAEWGLLDLDRSTGRNQLRIRPEANERARDRELRRLLSKPPVIRAVVDERTPAYEDVDPNGYSRDAYDEAAVENSELVRVGLWNCPDQIP